MAVKLRDRPSRATMYVADGNVLVHQNIHTDSAEFLRLIAPCRHDLVIAAECVFCRHWLAEARQMP